MTAGPLKWVCLECGFSFRDLDDEPEHDCIELLMAEREALRHALIAIMQRHECGPTNHAEGAAWSEQTYRWSKDALLALRKRP